ncbi:serine/threonine-protein kinase [Streptomyces sp. SID13726]|uniref:serine/threonine-protein kinase n=1 Tax=Streptomyces sp. SID13726 TaxID=2706058 RepID=UPI0013BBCE34|nr:serine/threonine-protein kinase [Streptomyces sp. SID13726]NEB00653.1 protein kinase [Streptomyces sp. SID13726]
MAGETPDHGEGRVVGGRYRLLRSLGAGGMGRVWLAYDDELACEVAMKEIALPDVPTDAGEPAQRIARARSEARHAARLRGHLHVATVHDVVVHEGLPWIVMEYVPDAVDLQAVVRRSGPLSPEQTARIGLAVLDALTAGHRIGILHRDVKPANILLAPDSSGDPYARVLLTDYGIALRPESPEPRLTATAGILGTPGYLAPERARGEPPTPAADLFSLGATLYAAVEGRGPFDRHGEYATLTALLGEEATPPVRSGELTPVLLGLLVKDPVRRFSPEAVKRGLERVVQGVPGAWDAGPAGAGYGVSAGGFGLPGGEWGSGPGAPATPGTPSTPGWGPPGPPGPPTPHTPAGASGAESAATPGSAPPSPPYGAWPPPVGQTPEPGNPYARGASSPYPSRQGGPGGPNTPGGSGSPGMATVAGAPTAFGGVYGSGGSYGPGGPAYLPPPPPRPASRKRLALVALVVGIVLVVAGGVWAAVSLTGDDGGDKPLAAKSSAAPGPSGSRGTASATGAALPYGEVVGLDEPLEAGDCVQAVWSGTAFRSAPNLGVVDCADDWPDGQVVAVDTAADFADAKARGAKRCADQSRAVVAALPDAAGYAVVPTREGFDAAGGGTACLVLGRHAAIGGEVGRFRDAGTDLWVGQMSVGDCWLYQELSDGYKAPLTDCSKPHTDQVIGTVQAPAEMSHKNGSDNATKLCGNKFESAWASGRERLVYGWVADEDDWDKGFTKIVCTVSLTDNKKSTGKVPPPGSV